MDVGWVVLVVLSLRGRGRDENESHCPNIVSDCNPPYPHGAVAGRDVAAAVVVVAAVDAVAAAVDVAAGSSPGHCYPSSPSWLGAGHRCY